MLVTKVGNVYTLMKELKEVDFLKQHLFRTDWQHAQFITMKNLDPFPVNSILMMMDFAENYTCTYQDEVQAAHWAHDQVTIHPAVTYYRYVHLFAWWGEREWMFFIFLCSYNLSPFCKCSLPVLLAENFNALIVLFFFYCKIMIHYFCQNIDIIMSW